MASLRHTRNCIKQTLVGRQSRTIAGNGFLRSGYMARSRFTIQASSSVDLLRSQFAGFLGDVTLTDEKAKKDADTLTSEGVLLKPNPAMACYRMASPLVDGLIRNQLIPARFSNAPSSPPPLQHTGDVDVLGIPIESLKFFDKAQCIILFVQDTEGENPRPTWSPCPSRKCVRY